MEHESFEDYFQCKLQLMKNCKLAVICRGTDHFSRKFTPPPRPMPNGSWSAAISPSCDLSGGKYPQGNPRLSFTVCDKNSRRDFRITMEGGFNIENALAAIAVARALRVPDDAIAAGIADVSVPGRMNVLRRTAAPVIVDYAHNFLSFTALFRSLKQDSPAPPSRCCAAAPATKT